MPDDGNKLMQIERGIDRQMANSMTIAHRGGGAVVMPTSMGELLEFSKLMSVSGICIRPAFRGNPGACLALTMQAMKWGADPFAVANKAYVTKSSRTGEETIAYEAQLVHAIVNSSPVLKQRLRPHYEGQGQDRTCRIVGYIVGEDEAFEYESPPIKQINPKNSPLWQSDTDQQLFYYSVRAWARRHVPEILLGIYTPDEFQGQTIEMEPQPEPRRQDFVPPRHLQETGRYYDVCDLDGEVHAFSDPHKAAAALRVVLGEGARRDIEVFDAAWDHNRSMLEKLDPKLMAELGTDYADLRERVIETARRSAAEVVRRHQAAAARNETPDPAEAGDPERNPDDVGAEAVGTAPATASGGSEGEAETRRTAAAETEQPSQAGSPPVAAPVERPEQGGGATSPQPSPARDERAADPTTALDAQRATNAGRGLETSRAQMEGDQANSVAGRGQTATSGASPFDGAEDRKSMLIPLPLNGGTGKPDHRRWALALLLPKVRRQMDGNELAWLLGDNAEAVEACRTGGLAGDDLRELEATIKAAWERCK